MTNVLVWRNINVKSTINLIEVSFLRWYVWFNLDVRREGNAAWLAKIVLPISGKENL